MRHIIAPMTPADFPDVLALWATTEGVGLNESDTPENLSAYLRRNPGFSLVARDAERRVVGAVLCGHEGRRGYLHHLAVSQDQRGLGLGRLLVDTCLAELKSAGITRCNIFVFADNDDGMAFWKHTGWALRDDLRMMQKQL
ncbi:MAG: GNAT family N-acetyltransferase [Limisphaerales bacterium]